MSGFRKINYGNMLYESLRAYFSVNDTGEMTTLFRFLAACIQPLQGPFDVYDSARVLSALVANCKWQIGQLTNLLNYLYDTTLNRIFLTQSSINNLAAPEFAYTTHAQVSDFNTAAVASAREFFDTASTTAVIVNVPAGVSISQITATIEQIKLLGIPYTINVF